MRRIIALSLAGAALMAQTEDTRRKFIGTWNLVSYQMKDPSGAVINPMTDHPLGRIQYTAGGHMSAQLSPPDRARPATDDRANQAKDQQAAAYSSYVAYFGDFELHESEGVIIHKVIAALNPTWTGTNQRRSYRFEDHNRRLILEADTNYRGQRQHATLVWEKLE